MRKTETAFAPMPRDLIITPEGYPFIIALIVLAFITTFMGWIFLTIPIAVLIIPVCFFFRNPRRLPPADPEAILAPADGRIIAIEKLKHYGPLLGCPTIKISTFMSIFSCHVNRVPVSGMVENVIYNPGQFSIASRDKASQGNERNIVLLKDTANKRLAIVQIAGIVARRIICYLKEGMKVKKGTRLGIIRFGSRVDLYLPDDSATLEVKKGERVKAGESIIGRWL